MCVYNLAYDKNRSFRNIQDLGSLQITVPGSKETTSIAQLLSGIQGWPGQKDTPATLLAKLQQAEGFDAVYLLLPLLGEHESSAASRKRMFRKWRLYCKVIHALKSAGLYVKMAELSQKSTNKPAKGAVVLRWLNQLSKVVFGAPNDKDKGWAMLCKLVQKFEQGGKYSNKGWDEAFKACSPDISQLHSVSMLGRQVRVCVALLCSLAGVMA